MELDDLRVWHVAGGLGGAAHHQHGTQREVRGDEAGDPSLSRERVERGEVPRPESGRSHNTWESGPETALDVPPHRVGTREVDRGVLPFVLQLAAALDARHLVPRLLELRPENRPHL